MGCFLLTTISTISTGIREECLSLAEEEKLSSSSQDMPCNLEAPSTTEVIILYRLSILLDRDKLVMISKSRYQIMCFLWEAQNNHDTFMLLCYHDALGFFFF